jgi:hypothetical protein
MSLLEVEDPFDDDLMVDAQPPPLLYHYTDPSGFLGSGSAEAGQHLVQIRMGGIVDEHVAVEVILAPGGGREASLTEGDDGEVRGKRRHLLEPDSVIAPEPVNEDQGRSRTILLVVDTGAVACRREACCA